MTEDRSGADLRDVELAAAQARIAKLEALGAERQRAERVHDALYRIAAAAGATEDLHAFYAVIHGIVAELMYADNCYIALYDDQRKMINFPYRAALLEARATR